MKEELVVDLFIAEHAKHPFCQIWMFFKASTDTFEYELVDSFVLLSDGNGQVENNRIFKDFFFNVKV